MNPRERRLLSDLEAMNALADSGAIEFRCEGDPPERYEVRFEGRGIALDDASKVVGRSSHRFEAYLHNDYPRHAPLLTWQSQVFHPNLLSANRRGAVCIGSWTASESLADLTERLIGLATLNDFNLDDALDKGAARLFREADFHPGGSVDELLGIVLDEESEAAGVELR